MCAPLPRQGRSEGHPGGPEQCDASGSDPVTIEAARIAGDRLELDIGHSGGCAPHSYRLCWDGALAESDPPQAQLALRHDANGDVCEAWLMDTLSFSLAPVSAAAGGPVVLSIGGKQVPYGR